MDVESLYQGELMETRSNRFVIALAVMVVWMTIILIGPKLQFGSGNISLDDLVSHGIVISLVIALLFLFAVVAFFGWWREVGFQSPEPSKSWLLVWFPALIIIAFLGLAMLLGLPSKEVIIYVLINTLFVGISEELMLRGILFHGAISRFSIWSTILITSIIFGAIHSLNGFLTGNFAMAAVQAVSAGMSGFWFVAIRLRTNSLYPAMVMHWLWDFVLFILLKATTSAAANANAPAVEPTMIQAIFVPIASALPTFLYGLWLLRGIGKRDKSEFLA